MNQDFSGGQAVSAPPCSCASKSPGDSDGCGGLCVDANGNVLSVVVLFVAFNRTNYVMVVVLLFYNPGSTIRPPDVSGLF